MKLYKFRSLSNVDYALDIILNERLHCAPFNKLNDPFEGIFLSVRHISSLAMTPINTKPLASRSAYKKPRLISNNLKVCSLTKSKSDVRLWAHYAAGHTGIAIEIDIDKDTDGLYEVSYDMKLKEFAPTVMTSPDPYEILRVKSKHWDYEDEFRLITEQDFFSVSGKITGIYLGLRTSSHMQEMLMRVVDDHIPIYTTKLNEQNIEIEVNEQIN